MKTLSTVHSFPRTRNSGFTLIELLVVVGIVAVLASLLLTSLTGAKNAASKVVCLSNKHQLGLAWSLYTDDNAGHLMINDVESDQPKPSPNWLSGTRMSWTNIDDVSSVLADEKSLLYGYAGKALGLFKCPADRYLAPAQKAVGWKTRPRSVSMNWLVGDTAANPWNKKDALASGYFLVWYRRVEQFRSLSPARIWIMTDEHPDTISDGLSWFDMGYDPVPVNWNALPASYHSGGSTLVFGDGHAEYKKWVLPETRQPVLYELWLTGNNNPRRQALVYSRRDDYDWLGRRTSTPKPSSDQ